MADTRRFFRKLRQEKGLESHVHVVWYVIDLTQARFQPFEAEFCRKQLEGIPIIFVFNKADCVTPEVRDTMMRTVREFNLPNCRALFATVADCKNFDSRECPKCGSTKIRKRLREGTCTVLCKECKEQTLLTKTSGIEELSRTTQSCLPDFIQDTFLVNQNANVLDLQEDAKRIILQKAHGLKFTKSEAVAQHLTQMISELAKHYRLDSVSEMACDVVMKRFQFFYRDRRSYKKALMVLGDIFKKTNQAQALVVLSGLEMCFALINLRRSLIAIAVEEYGRRRANGNNDVENVQQVDDSRAPQGDIENVPYWRIEKIISNMHIDVDNESVHTMALKLKQFGSVEAYLQNVKIDGTRSYRDVEPVKLDEEWDLAGEEDDDDYIPIHNYQRQQIERMKANEALSSQQTQQGSDAAVTVPQETRDA